MLSLFYRQDAENESNLPRSCSEPHGLLGKLISGQKFTSDSNDSAPILYIAEDM